VRLAQIIGNLLHNAAKFTPVGGQVALTAALEGDMLVIRIADNGIGIAPGSAARIFDLFAQAQHVSDRVQDGLGIGLSLVRKLVELHGGTVTVSSQGEGLGSTFEVRLPVMASAPLPVPAAASAGASTEQGYRILVVDDSADSAAMLCALLEINGHTVSTSNTGKGALATAASFRPDIVFLDIGLPDMTGYEVAATLRSMPETAKAMLVALTGYGQQKDKKDAMAAGFDHHLVKPINFDALMALTSRKPSASA
jgi:CheY-like chemotaxis protein